MPRSPGRVMPSSAFSPQEGEKTGNVAGHRINHARIDRKVAVIVESEVQALVAVLDAGGVLHGACGHFPRIPGELEVEHEQVAGVVLFNATG